MEQLFNGCLLRVEKQCSHVVVVDSLPCLSVVWTEIVFSLVPERLILLYQGEGEGGREGGRVIVLHGQIYVTEEAMSDITGIHT